MVGFPSSESVSMTALDMDPNDRDTPSNRNVGFGYVTDAAYLQVLSAPLSSIRTKRAKSKKKCHLLYGVGVTHGSSTLSI